MLGQAKDPTQQGSKNPLVPSPGLLIFLMGGLIQDWFKSWLIVNCERDKWSLELPWHGLVAWLHIWIFGTLPRGVTCCWLTSSSPNQPKTELLGLKMVHKATLISFVGLRIFFTSKCKWGRGKTKNVSVTRKYKSSPSAITAIWRW
jgi:hypothetical protein